MGKRQNLRDKWNNQKREAWEEMPTLRAFLHIGGTSGRAEPNRLRGTIHAASRFDHFTSPTAPATPAPPPDHFP